MFCNKRGVFWFLSLVLLFSLLLVLPASASAAERTRRPVEAMPAVAEGSAFLYKEVNDFREIVSRFALSNAARSLSMIDEGVRWFFEVLRFWPAESMVFLIGEEARGEGGEIVCFALSYPETYRSVLQKMEKGTIKDVEARSLFLGSRKDNEVALRITREDEKPPIFKVRFGDFRFYCTARDNLLVCAFDDDELDKPLAALSSGRHFTPPSRAGKGTRNFAVVDAGLQTDKIMSDVFKIARPDAKGDSLHVEMDFAFQPGGWKLDVETNLAALLNQGKGETKGGADAAIPAFERLGGGRLLAATSAVLGTDSIYARASRVTRGIFPKDDSSPPILRALLGDDKALGMERVDVAALSYPGLKWPDGIGLYTCVKVSNKTRLAELQRETDAFLAENAQSDPYTKLESAKWKHLYAMDLRGEGIESSVMLGFADDAFLFGFLPRTGLGEPFATDRARFEELAAKPDAFFYADFERTRQSVREMWSRDDDEPYNRRRRAREFYSLLLAVTSDITELSAVEKDPGTISIEAKTARPDIDDRMWIYELMEKM